VSEEDLKKECQMGVAIVSDKNLLCYKANKIQFTLGKPAVLLRHYIWQNFLLCLKSLRQK